MDYKVLEDWVNINSGSHNLEGLKRMANAITGSIEGLPGRIERITPPSVTALDGGCHQSGDAIRFRFNPDAAIRVLFSGHMDTVFDSEHPFQKLEHLPDGRIHGPGVADMKGGLFIMIESAKRFLGEDRSGALGGEILITADEELGSIGSMELLREAARWNQIGLVFESALPGGELVRCRKGTGTFQLTCHGRAAHTGRDFEQGRNAVAAMAGVVKQCHELNKLLPGVIVNVANFASPGPVNVVPEFAEAWLNIRISDPADTARVKIAIDQILKSVESETDGIGLHLRGGFLRLPKVETGENARLHEIWNLTEGDLGLPLSGKRDTGGSSDGNVFGAEGLPHLDGVGIVGGDIHSDREFAWPDSIRRQVDKTVGFLHRIAADPGFLEMSTNGK